MNRSEVAVELIGRLEILVFLHPSRYCELAGIGIVNYKCYNNTIQHIEFRYHDLAVIF